MRIIPPAPKLDLEALIDNEEFLKALTSTEYREAAKKCNASYRHWDKVRFFAKADGLDPKLLWAIISVGRMSEYRDIPFTDKAGQQLKYALPDRILREQMMIDQELAGRIAIEDDGALTDSTRERFIISSLMEEAIASSQLEGASTAHRVAKEMLRKDRAPRDRSERMIVNNYRAILFIRGQKSTPLSTDLLIELQRILTENTLEKPDQCGRLRRPGEIVEVVDPYDEVLHTPPAAESLDDRLNLLCEFANQPTQGAGQFVHPLVRAISLHFQLAYDHPFCDGNGRTARMLFYWSMLRRGYWLIEFMPISRLIYKGPSKYAKAFQYVETDSFDLTYFLDYHTRIIQRARRDLKKHLETKRKQIRAARKAFRSSRINDRQRSLLMHSLDNFEADYTIASHQSLHGISYFTARDDLLDLEQLGYLDKRRIGKKFVFSATPLVQQHAVHD